MDSITHTRKQVMEVKVRKATSPKVRGVKQHEDKTKYTRKRKHKNEQSGGMDRE